MGTEQAATGYVRLSREAGETNLSKDGMIRDVEALAEREGLRLVTVHVDDGISGAVRDRPAFTAWLDDVRQSRAGVMIAWHVDRITREGVNAAAMILDVLEGKNPQTGKVERDPARLLDTRGLDSAHGDESFRLRFVFAAEIARAERERMRDRARAAKARLLAEGRFIGGTAPFGTRIVANPDGAGRVLEVEPVEAAALRTIAGRLFAGESFPALVRWLNREGPAPRRAASWSRTTLRQSLTSEAASSLIFGAAERRLLAERLAPSTNGAGGRGGRKPSRLLSGLLVCSGCGTRLQIGHNGSGRRAYRCHAKSDGLDCPRPVTVGANGVEEVVSALWLGGWGSLPETVLVRAVDSSADALAEAEERVEAAAAEVVRLRGAERLDALARLEAVEAERDALAAEPISTLSSLHNTGRTYRDVWQAGDTDDRRALLLRTVWGGLTIAPGRPGGSRFDPARIVDAWRLDPVEWDERGGLSA